VETPEPIVRIRCPAPEGEARCRRRVGELGLGDAVRFDSDYIPEAKVPLYLSAADAVVPPPVPPSSAQWRRALAAFA
jgi:glycosyltransferase involved in cell wall biosynthesis